jgi:hypothetical protein
MSYLIQVLLGFVLLFFLFLPITDRRTVMMKLGMMAVIAALFTVSITRAHGPRLFARLPQTFAMSIH